MPFNGSGIFQAPSAPTFPAVAGQRAMAARFNDTITDIHTGLSGCITKDGQTAITANIPLSGFKITGAADGTADTDYATVGQVDTESMMRRGTTALAVDLDTLTSAGSYDITDLTDCTNIPTTATVGIATATDTAALLVIDGAGGTISQVLLVSDGSFFHRTYATTWGGWRRVDNPGAVVSTGINFNLYITPGTYPVSATAMAASTNRPYDYVGATQTNFDGKALLTVSTFSQDTIRQSVQAADDNREFYRVYSGSTWSNWQCVYPSGFAGTFTPTITGGTFTRTYTSQDGMYWRIGPMVYYEGYIVYSSGSGSATSLQLLLPVAASLAHTAGANHTVSLENWSDSNLTNFIGTRHDANYITIRADSLSGSARVNVGSSDLPTAMEIRYSGWYIAAANV